MPYLREYIPAEVFLEYKGVTIYHVYVDDDPSLGTRELWFDTNADSRDDEGFYVPDLSSKLESLPNQLKAPKDATDTPDEITTIIRRAIRAGLITNPGNESKS